MGLLWIEVWLFGAHKVFFRALWGPSESKDASVDPQPPIGVTRPFWPERPPDPMGARAPCFPSPRVQIENAIGGAEHNNCNRSSSRREVAHPTISHPVIVNPGARVQGVF